MVVQSDAVAPGRAAVEGPGVLKHAAFDLDLTASKHADVGPYALLGGDAVDPAPYGI